MSPSLLYLPSPISPHISPDSLLPFLYLSGIQTLSSALRWPQPEHGIDKEQCSKSLAVSSNLGKLGRVWGELSLAEGKALDMLAESELNYLGDSIHRPGG